MLTTEAIAAAKTTTPYTHPNEIHHEHDDCIRIAYQWLDAQTKTRNPVRKHRALKHMVEQWGARYVSRNDVEVAAHLHPEITGSYPYFNVSSRLVSPSFSRLKDIGEAETQMSYRRSHESDFKHTYSRQE